MTMTMTTYSTTIHYIIIINKYESVESIQGDVDDDDDDDNDDEMDEDTCKEYFDNN